MHLTDNKLKHYNVPGTSRSLPLTSASDNFAISLPSTKIRPAAGSTKRKSDSASVLRPEPVFPTIATFSPAEMERLRPSSAFGRDGYEMNQEQRWQGPRGLTYGIANDQPADLNGTLAGPHCLEVWGRNQSRWSYDHDICLPFDDHIFSVLRMDPRDVCLEVGKT